MKPVHVVGASGKSGSALCRILLAAGRTVVPVVRNSDRWAATGIATDPCIADVETSSSLRSALEDASIVVSCTHARHTSLILAATAPTARLVLLGSTRRFTRWLDAHGNGVIAGESAMMASGRSAVMLHPTMIYGADGEDDVQRLEGLLRRLPVIPLPGGGRNLIQPIHQNDVTRCIVSALDIDWQRPQTIVIAGPKPVSYVDFVRSIASAARLPPPRIIALPAWAVIAASPVARIFPGIPAVSADEIRRLLEDKAFSVSEMTTRLGVIPMPLDAGLLLTFPRAP